MGGPTAHPTGVTLVSGDPSNSLNARYNWGGSRPRWLAAPVFVLEAGRRCWRVLAGGGAVEDMAGKDSWTQSGLLCRRGSNVEGDDPFDGGECDRREVPRRNPGRCGERGRQEEVERLLRLGWEQRPWRSQAGPRSCEQRSARWLLLDPSLEAGSDPAWY